MSAVAERLKAWIDNIETEFVMSIEVEKFIAYEREHHEAEFYEWLTETAASTAVSTLMRVHQSNQRSSARSPAKFEAQAKRFMDGDTEAMSAYRTSFTVSADNLRKPVGQMTGDDHMYVANEYRNNGKKAMLFDAFHRAIAKKIGGKTTAEVLPEYEYARLQQWFVNGRRKDAELELGE